jgi:hypothetical protein
LGLFEIFLKLAVQLLVPQEGSAFLLLAFKVRAFILELR